MLIWVLAENPARRIYESLVGCYVRKQPITIGKPLLEVAYGWKDIAILTKPESRITQDQAGRS